MPDHLTCLLRNLYACQEATVRTGLGKTDWFQVGTDWFHVGKGVHQCCILSLCLFNIYAEYIMRNAGLEEAQAGIKIARRNINNLRYTESEEELKSLLMKVKEESEKVGLKLLLLLLSRFSHVRLCATPETAAHQAPPSLGLSRQEHWSGMPFPSPMHESEK